MNIFHSSAYLTSDNTILSLPLSHTHMHTHTHTHKCTHTPSHTRKHAHPCAHWNTNSHHQKGSIFFHGFKMGGNKTSTSMSMTTLTPNELQSDPLIFAFIKKTAQINFSFMNNHSLKKHYCILSRKVDHFKANGDSIRVSPWMKTRPLNQLYLDSGPIVMVRSNPGLHFRWYSFRQLDNAWYSG